MKQIKPRLTLRFTGIACLFLLMIASARAQFTFPVYEPFNYPEGERLGIAGGGSLVNWEFGNSASSTSSPLVSSTNALSYPGLLPDPNTPPKGIFGATGVGRTRAATFTPQTSGTVYSSFLLNLTTLPSGPRAIFGINGSSSGTPSPSSGCAVWVNSLGQLLLSKNNATTPATNTTSPLSIGGTYLIVMAYKYGVNPNEVDLWVNPTALGNDSTVPAPTISTTNNANSTTLQSICLYAPSSTPVMTEYFDEIRVDNHWAGVTPAGCSPGGTYTVTGGGSGCPGDAFAVGLSSSDLNVNYLVYTNGVISSVSALGTGGVLTFGPQSTTAAYTVLASNINTACVAWMTGSAIINVLTPPSIVTQPVTATVATNSLATFTVSAAGTGLNYQWYKNSAALTDGGHISGSATATLAISPATTADQAAASAGYYVIITNRCGYSAVSITNALVLQPPANLVWQGGNPTNTWDLGVSANWLNGAVPAVFQNGDNVSFDDTAQLFKVNVTGTSLSPGTITMNNNGNTFIFTGSGSLTGSGAFIDNGVADITISNANAFTGGATLNSGQVTLANYAGLGSGNVTMAGGNLEFTTTGSATVGLSNNVNVTANSTLYYDGAGSFGGVVFGNLTGSPSATLTIYHYLSNSSTTADRLRFYGGFTNSLQLALTTSGNLEEISPYNTAGSQVYNGLISGSGRFTPRGAGNVIFNNGGNTFNDGTYGVILSGESTGVGADTTAASPPTIDSGPLGNGLVEIDIGFNGSGLFASGGAHTIGYHFVYNNSLTNVAINLSGSNALTLSGEFSLTTGSDATPTNRTLNVVNTTPTIFSGVIDDNNLGSGIIKMGAGALYLNGTNTYTGTTTTTNGLLSGSGIIAGPVSIQAGSSIGGGSPAAIGTLGISNNLSLAGGVLIRVNKSLAQSNDVITVTGTLANSGTGTVTVTNLGAALAVGNSFKIFNKPLTGGNTLTVTGGGVTWNNHLATDGGITVAAIAPTAPPVFISTILNGVNLVSGISNGAAGSMYYVLATTNLTLPVGSWTPVSTSTYPSGVFYITNTVTPGTAQKFFMLSPNP